MSKTKTTAKAATKKVETVESVTAKVARTIDTREMKFISKGGKIDTAQLSTAFESLVKDAERSNNGNLTAARRFRLNTSNMSKQFLELRKASPKMGKED